MRWKTAVQTKSDKQSLTDSVPMRESPLVVPHLKKSAGGRKNFSEVDGTGRLKGGCGQDWPPHIPVAGRFGASALLWSSSAPQ
jgi:hypothetical protein